MAVIDLWYLKARGDNKKRLKSKRYGRGKRYRVEYVDADGKERSEHFTYEKEAKDFDAKCRTGVAPEQQADRTAKQLTFPGYAEGWKDARMFSWEPETRKRIPSNIQLHLNPAFPGLIGRITQTDVLRWISNRVTDSVSPTPISTMKLHFDVFNTIMNAAVVDGIIPANPCKGIKLSAVFKGIESRPRWVPNEQQVIDLYGVVPEQYHLLITYGAAQALRISEALAIEDEPHCFDFEQGKLGVFQQLQFGSTHGGFFLKEPKSGSSGWIDFDTMAMQATQNHLTKFGTTEAVLVDAVNRGKVRQRTAKLLFVDGEGRPINDSKWSRMWIPWRNAAGWPEEGGGFHALRHFWATISLMNLVDPAHVQLGLRHKLLQTTLAIYAHWLPRQERPKDLISQLIMSAVRARPDYKISSQTYPALTG